MLDKLTAAIVFATCLGNIWMVVRDGASAWNAVGIAVLAFVLGAMFAALLSDIVSDP